jgi:glycine hydroxymethyltransferase
MNNKVQQLIAQELERQKNSINLIPSENYASKAVLKANASVLSNKYSEGVINRRYYPGNQIVDEIEQLCQKRVKQLFNLNDSWSVNVQTLSGTPANLAVYLALLNPGEKILSMELASGGHLSHGHTVNASSLLYKIAHYTVSKDNQRLDYQEIEKRASKEKAKIIVCGATAYPRKINFKKFAQIAHKNGAYLMADISHIAGLVAAKLHPSPFPYADVVTSTTHKTLRGPRSAIIISHKKISKKINRAVFPGMQGGPHNHTIAAKLVAFEEALQPSFKEYQKQIIKNAKVLAQSLKQLKFKLVTNGTDNHLILMDLKNLIDATKAQDMLEEVSILSNRNTVPGDSDYFHPSGLRLGTPAATTRGMKEKEMQKIAHLLYDTLFQNKEKSKIKTEVKKLCQEFPIY